MTEPLTPEEEADLSAAAAEFAAAQQAEYGQYVAAQDIRFDGALAFTTGQAVPASTVDRLGLHTFGLVHTVEEAAQRRKDAEDAAAAEEAARLAEQLAAQAPPPEKPSGNASRDDWAAYALTVDPSNVEWINNPDTSRNDLRDAYTEK